MGLPNDAGDAGGRSVFGPRGGLSDAERALVQRFHCSQAAAAAKHEGGGGGEGNGHASTDSVGFFISKFVKTESIRSRGMVKAAPP